MFGIGTLRINIDGSREDTGHSQAINVKKTSPQHTIWTHQNGRTVSFEERGLFAKLTTKLISVESFCTQNRKRLESFDERISVILVSTLMFPQMFTKLLKFPTALLRKMMVRIVFFDDTWIIAASIENWQWLGTV